MASLQALENQFLNLTLPDGITIAPIGIPDINEWNQYGVRVSINYASQIGASAALLAVLLLTTRSEKRTSSIFWINTLALAINVPRLILACCYFTSAWYGFYETFGGDYSQITSSDYSTSIAVLPLVLVVHCLVNTSLVLQVHAVCATMRRIHRLLITLLSVAVAIAAVGVRFGLTVWNVRYIEAAQDFAPFAWLVAANNYMTAASVCFFSFIFAAKLGEALLRRRRLHIKQFGPMQILFIGACQTLIIPAMFAILQNVTTAPELGTQALTITALSLPLTSMWASASVVRKPEDRNNGPRDNNAVRTPTSPASAGLRAGAAPTPSTTSSKRHILASLFNSSASPTTPTSNAHEKGSISASSPTDTDEIELSPKSIDGAVYKGNDELDHDMRMHLGRDLI